MWWMKIVYYVFVSGLLFGSVLAAAFDNIFGIWTPFLNYLGEGWRSYAIVYAVFLVAVIVWDVVSERAKKNKQEPSQGG